MAQGRPTKWIEIKVEEPIYIGKRGVQIKVWKKHEHSKRGIFYLTVGGLWWREHEKKNWKKKTWEDLQAFFDGE
jgi:hypothetical protein